MFEESILTSIDSIQESVDSTWIAVSQSMCNYFNKFAMILENESDVLGTEYDIIQEADTAQSQQSQSQQSEQTTTQPTKRKGILRSLFEMIKKVLRFIASIFGKIIRFLGGLFKKKAKSADQIATEVGIKPASTSTTTGKNKQVTYTIPIIEEAANGSKTKKEDKVTLAAKECMIALNNNNTFSIIDDGFFDKVVDTNAGNDKGENPVPKVKGAFLLGRFLAAKDENGNNWGESLLLAYKKFIDAIKNNESESIIQKCANAVSHLTHGYRKSPDIYDKLKNIKYSQLHKAQKDVTALAVLLEDAKLDAKEIDKLTMQTFKDMYNQLNGLQMSLNTVSSSISQIYTLDQRFVAVADTVEQLADFAKKSIDSGIPPRNIANNVYLLAKPELRGTTLGIKAGQSRAVCFPDNNPSVVYKFAMNGMGLAANKTEHRIWNMTKKPAFSELGKFLAPVQNSFADHACIVMARADKDSVGLNRVSYMVVDSIEAFEKHHPDFPYDITDLHAGNVGRLNGNPVAIDYGWVSHHVD